MSDQKPESSSAQSPAGVAMTVVGADHAPTLRDQQLLQAAQQQLAADPNFKALAQPVLSRCEINAGLSDTADGYLYLRYDVLHAVPQEFWAQAPPTESHYRAFCDSIRAHAALPVRSALLAYYDWLWRDDALVTRHPFLTPRCPQQKAG